MLTDKQLEKKLERFSVSQEYIILAFKFEVNSNKKLQ